MYIEKVPNRNSPPAVLLRESYREGKKVKKRTLANLSKLPDEVVDNLRLSLKGAKVINQEELPELCTVLRSLPHGHVAWVLGTINKLGIPQLIESKKTRRRDLAVAMIVSRIINPTSKLGTVRGIRAETANSSLGELLGLSHGDRNEYYEALDWLLSKQINIENALASRHLQNGSLILYDLTSTYLEGTECSLAAYGYSRDKKKGKLQIVFGILCNQKGCPIAIEVFQGNSLDSQTLGQQISKVRQRFGIAQVVWVGDRGTITNANILDELKAKEGLDWITALTKSQIRKLAEVDYIQLGLFDEQDVIEIESNDYPGERLIACRNPLIAKKNAQVREELLLATEKELDKIKQATTREKRALKGADKIGLRVGKVLNKFQVGKLFEIEISDSYFAYRRKSEVIEREKTLEVVYIIRTSVESEKMDAPTTVRAYKGLSKVEQAFRCLKTIDLKVRPIYHYLDHRVKGHIFLCFLAYYVEWHIRKALAPILFEEEDLEKFESSDSGELLQYQPSLIAKQKAANKRNQENLPVHSFSTLLNDLATIAHNRIQINFQGDLVTFDKITQPTALQQKALDLLGVSLICTQ
ncbi:MAG: IS1634 family transposase [Pleurocapsa sp. MO_226.B13]|nr:IS1634 family transposase [Pleurocapsa sp. MO_226.B13]